MKKNEEEEEKYIPYQEKKYFKIRYKKKEKNYFSFFSIKIFISLILFIILGLFEFLNLSPDFNNSEIKIIESKEYKNFNKIKNFKNIFFFIFFLTCFYFSIINI